MDRMLRCLETVSQPSPKDEQVYLRQSPLLIHLPVQGSLTHPQVVTGDVEPRPSDS
jgi:hypothetical protein